MDKNTNIIFSESIYNPMSDEEFRALALNIFYYQAKYNKVYKEFLEELKLKPEHVKTLEAIPFLPIEFFKSRTVITESLSPLQEPNSFLHKPFCFTSSGNVQSKHYVKDISIYEKSYLKGFERFYGNIDEYCILALLPSYLEREGSSLIYMAEDLIKKSKHPKSGFYLNNYDELFYTLQQLESKKQKTILLGVTYALLDLIEQHPLELHHTIVMETGGMKGKRKEIIREELHDILCKGYGVSAIHSEYGMTELLSQAYSKGNGIFDCPPWMKIFIRSVNDPFQLEHTGKTGGINVIDLANVNSCSFIATQDLGKLYSDGHFEVLGRFDNSDVRGCNLLI